MNHLISEICNLQTLNRLHGAVMWKFSNKLLSSSARASKGLTDGSRCSKTDIPTMSEFFHTLDCSCKFKENSKYYAKQGQNSEKYSILIPCERNNSYLFNSDRNGSPQGVISSLLSKIQTRPIADMQELLATSRSNMMVQSLIEYGMIKRMMGLPWVQQMRFYVGFCNANNTPSISTGKQNILGSICDIHEIPGNKRNIGSTTTTHKKTEFCPPKKQTKKDSDPCAPSTKEHENKETCKEADSKTDVKPPPYCKSGKDDSKKKKECLVPSSQKAEKKDNPCAPTKPAKTAEKKDDHCAPTKAKDKMPTPPPYCKKDEGKKGCATQTDQKSAAMFCTKAENKIEEKKDPCTTSKMQMKASTAGPGSKEPDQKELKQTKKEDPSAPQKSQKKTAAPAQGPNGPHKNDQKKTPKEEAMKDPCVPQKKSSDEHKTAKEESKKALCTASKSSAPAQERTHEEAKSERKQQHWNECCPKTKKEGEVPCAKLPPPKPQCGKKPDGDGAKTVPIWQCAAISTTVTLLSLAILYMVMRKRESKEEESDLKGRPVKKK